MAVLLLASTALGQAVSMSGTLRTADGRPVPGATVHLNTGTGPDMTSITGLDGSYFFVAAPDNYQFYADSPQVPITGLPARWSFEAPTFDLTADRVANLTLPPISTVTVNVLDSADAPLANTTVTMPRLEGPADFGDMSAVDVVTNGSSATTGSSGSVSFTVFSGGSRGTNDLGIVTPPGGSGYGVAHYDPATITHDTTFDVRPPRPVSLSGTLRAADGRPVPGATVHLNTGIGADMTSLTDADGRYAFEAAPDHYQFYADSPQIPVAGLPAQWFFEAPTFDLTADRVANLTLPPTSTVTVNVLDDADAPLADTSVSIPRLEGTASLGGMSGVEVVTASKRATTDASGRVAFTVFSGGSRGFNDLGIVTPPAGSGYGVAHYDPATITHDTTFDVHPPRTITVSGTLHTALGQAVEGVTVQLESDVGAVLQSSTGADGSFSFVTAPGRYELLFFGNAAQATNLPPRWSVETSLFDAQADRTVNLTLPATSTLTVRVRGIGTSAIAGATVMLPDLLGSADLGDVTARAVITGKASAMTDSAGDAAFTVFDGGAQRPNGDPGVVVPPGGSGYVDAEFPISTIAQDTTLIVRPESTAPPTAATISPTSRDFGSRDVTRGPTAARVFTVRNRGTNDLDIRQITLAGPGADQFQLVAGADTCTDAILAPAATCTVSVVFDPSSVGAASAQLQMPSNASSPLTATLTGTGTETLIGRLTPATRDFGSRDIGAGPSARRLFTVRNAGTGTLVLGQVGLSGADADQFQLVPGEDTCSRRLLAPAATCTAAIVFDPFTAGTKSAQLDMPSNASSPLSATLTGTATVTFIGRLTPATHSFGSRRIARGPTAATVFTVRNVGSGALTLGQVALAGAVGDQFQLTEDGCSGQLLTSSASCTVSVSFDPSTTGAKSAQLAVPSNATRPLVANVTGTGS